MRKIMLCALSALLALTGAAGAQNSEPATPTPDATSTKAVLTDDRYEYRLLATNKTSTMEKEMNRAADDGFRFQGVMGGETGFGGHEVVIVVGRPTGAPERERYDYKLLATQKTSTMQKELQEAANAGFEYKGQTIFETAFGGKEVVVILERDHEKRPEKWEYRLLATKKTSTMENELEEAARQGFQLVGLTVANTSFGGAEVVTILRRAQHTTTKATTGN